MAFKHPKCGGTHETAAEARICEGVAQTKYDPEPARAYGSDGKGNPVDLSAEYGAEPGEVEKAIAAKAPTYRSATDPMVNFVEKIATRRSMHQDDADEALRFVAAHRDGTRPMSFQFAKGFIDAFKNAPWRTERTQGTPTRVTEDGMYRDPESGKIYKVQYPREHKGEASRLYAKLLVVVSDAERDTDGVVVTPAKVRFDFISGLVKEVKPGWRMTLAEAKKFGAMYGVCCDCGRTLTREQSINAGVGPKCGEDGRWAAGKVTVEVL